MRGDPFSGIKFDFSEDLFSEVFRKRAPKGRTLRALIEITLEEAAVGGLHQVVIPKVQTCIPCQGTGAENAERITCSACHGTGLHVNDSWQNNFVFRIRETCHTCGGGGFVPKSPCSKCNGTGLVENSEKLEVSIPPGILNGQILRLIGRGEMGPGGPGDLHFVVKIKTHPKFRREGDKLYGELEIPFLIALRGGSVEYENLFKEKLWLKIPKAFPYGHEVEVPNKGINGGPLVVRLTYRIPALEDSQINKIAEAIA
jgi:molecular chaperone DnaJ